MIYENSIWGIERDVLSGPVKPFSQAIDRLLPVTRSADEDGRMATKGILLDTTDPFTLCVTDGYRFIKWGDPRSREDLTLVKCQEDYWDKGDIKMILPVENYDVPIQTLPDILKLLKKHDYFTFYASVDETDEKSPGWWYEDTRRYKIDVYAGASKGESQEKKNSIGTMYSVSARFPNLSKASPDVCDMEHVTRVDGGLLFEALDASCKRSKYNKDKNRSDAVILECDEKTLSIRRCEKNASKGEESSTIPCKCTDSWKQKVNLFFLRDLCSIGGPMRLLQGFSKRYYMLGVHPSPISVRWDDLPLYHSVLMTVVLDPYE